MIYKKEEKANTKCREGFKHNYAKDAHMHTHACTHARTHARTHTHTHARTHTRKFDSQFKHIPGIVTGVRLGGCRSSASDYHVQVAWLWLLHFFLSSILTLVRYVTPGQVCVKRSHRKLGRGRKGQRGRGCVNVCDREG